jgi:hypothetical protein
MFESKIEGKVKISLQLNVCAKNTFFFFYMPTINGSLVFLCGVVFLTVVSAIIFLD